MELRSYLSILWRRKWIIATTAAMTLTVTIIGMLMFVPVYTATTTLRIATAAGGSPDYVSYDITYADRLMNTYNEIAMSGPILAELARKLGLDKPPEVDVEVPANTELLKITVEHSNPNVARDAANTLADLLIAQVREQYDSDGKTAQDILREQLAQAEEDLNQARENYETVLTQFAAGSPQDTAAKRALDLREDTYARQLEQYERARITEAVRANTISIVEPAVVPLAPSKPQKVLNIGLGLILGLVAGVSLAILFENMDTTLHTTEQIEQAAALPTLGNIPVLKRGKKRILFENNSPQNEAFRRLRTNLLALEEDASLHTLLVTSAEPGEGKSTIVANLACAMAELGSKVILVDGDLRLPTLHKIFDLPNQFGLSSLLEQKISLDTAIQRTNIAGLQVLPSGPLPANPAELLGSARMHVLLRQLSEHSDIVLLDTPALMAVTDTAVLATSADGVILVVRRAHSRQEMVRAACQQLASVKAQALGIVVNRAKLVGGDGYLYYQRIVARPTQSYHYRSNGMVTRAKDGDAQPPFDD
jgi:polysaccharide biosynthesis transport protein